ncbi:MAG: hypothetical protein OXQ29_19830 [Rhodospirillaceae bacterium]|nr:hypothetical protein [Rhodospirillaceae bacterium]
MGQRIAQLHGEQAGLGTDAARADLLLARVAQGLSHLRIGKGLSAHGFGSGEDIVRLVLRRVSNGN